MKVLRFAHVTVFVIVLFCTLGLSQSTRAQERPSQETINALTQERLTQLEAHADNNTKNISELSQKVAALTTSIDRFTGLGMGIGATLTVLQALLLLLTFRNGKKG